MDVSGKFFGPWIDDWLECVAVRAAVPEHLDDFDFAWLGNRNSAFELDVLFAGFDRLCCLSGQTEQAGKNQSGAENQITHA
jgi:hypothetical protein